jgi:GDP-L-fucose synthase
MAIAKSAKIYVAGHQGLVGSAITARLEELGYKNLILKTRNELDLIDSMMVDRFFQKEKPQYVVLAAAKVGGILANSQFGADFIYENLMIEANVLKSAQINKVKKLLFLGSSCIYPKMAPQPIKEDYFLDGKLEETNKPYAVAKIAGITMCEAFNKQYKTNFISVMPTNLYGPRDNFDLNSSHVLPALIRKFHEAKVNKRPFVLVWGTGKPKREFLYIEDLADACVFLLSNYDKTEFVNIGTGEDISIKKLANTIKKVVGYKGEIKFDSSKPDGTPRKLLNVNRLHKLGWKAKTDLETGITQTYKWFLDNWKN